MKNELTAQQAAVLSEALSRLEKLLQFADGDMKSATVGLINSQLLNSKPDGKGTFLSDAMNSLKGAAVWKILNDALRPVMSLKTNNSGEQRQKSLNTLRAVVVSLRDESSSALIDQSGQNPDAGGRAEEWLSPRSVRALVQETGCSQTTINTDVKHDNIPGGALRENNKTRGNVILKQIGLDYLKRKGKKDQ